jgi:hypothetical protein
MAEKKKFHFKKYQQQLTLFADDKVIILNIEDNLQKAAYN